jgi:Leucine-rich repeat (LRR) protein
MFYLTFQLNLKGNLVENVSENAFWGLEETLMDVDMSENKLKAFPYSSLRKLRLLSTLNLAWNALSDLSSLLIHQGLPVLATTVTDEGRPSNKKSGSSGAFDMIRYGLKNGGISPGKGGGGLLQESGASSEKDASMDWPLLKYLNLNSNYLRVLEKGTFSSMRNLRTLTIHLNSIESLDPEVFFPLTELESLDLSHNKLILLPPSTFERNAQLISIDLSNNHLHSVGDGLFQNLPELRELFLNGNNILRLVSPTFTNSPKISILYLQGNALRYVESGAFTPLKNLTEIRLSDNFLRILPQDMFFGNGALTSISLDGNHLAKLAPGTFHNCKGLRELRLQNNGITSIPLGVLDTLEHLEEVHLENNKLTSLRGLDSLKRIRHVTLSRNSLEKITGEMLPGTELSSLSLGHNSIKTVQDGAFENQTTLNILFLGNNKLIRLGPRMFLGLRSLERLYLGKNNISWIHSDCFSGQMKALQFLDLSYNSLKVVDSTVFGGLAFIEEINLSNNMIEVMADGAFIHLRSLRIIDLSSNHLKTVDYSEVFHPGGLEILKMCCNSLVEFHANFGRPTAQPVSSGEMYRGGSSQYGQVALKELDLQGNWLTGSVFRQIEMGRVEVLQISGNNLTDLDEAMLDGFPSLSFFSAERAHITTLPPTLFRSNGALAVIRLSDNFISHIPESAFLPESGGRSLSSPIRELHLRNNKLRAFPYKALANTSLLEVLTLSGNRINTLDLNRIALPRLKQLDMNDNRLGKISGSSLSKSMPLLQVVDFGENNISRVVNEFVRNLSLSQINFGGNSMDKVPYAFSDKWVGSGSGSSFVLNMSGNPLMNFYTEDHHMTNFSVMDLYLCDTNVSYLTSEEFKIYPRLHRLVIKRNPLSILPPAAFSSLEKLNLLDLSENEIEEVKVDSFEGLMQLKSLNLSRNRIKSVELFHHNLGGLQVLTIFV